MLQLSGCSSSAVRINVRLISISPNNLKGLSPHLAVIAFVESSWLNIATSVQRASTVLDTVDLTVPPQPLSGCLNTLQYIINSTAFAP